MALALVSTNASVAVTVDVAVFPEIKVAAEYLSLSFTGSMTGRQTFSVSVTGHKALTAASSAPDWCAVTCINGDIPSVSITVTANPNPQREADVTLSAEGMADVVIHVAQAGYSFERSYQFSDGVIPRNVLQSYLSRAITQLGFLGEGKTLTDWDDNARMVRNVGAKFIGRAIACWAAEPQTFNPAVLGYAEAKMKAMHQLDPDLVFQSCIFEIVSKQVDQIAIPGWVFEAFGLPVENRNFRYDDIASSQMMRWLMDGTAIPDITRQETQLLFYYMAVEYMKTGIEAIHWGQIMLIGKFDTNLAAFASLLEKVRLAAKTYARRGTVICDGHTAAWGEIYADGKLLLDFTSGPMLVEEVIHEPHKCILRVGIADSRYCNTKGGISPSGWSSDRGLYLVEFDNDGVTTNHPGVYGTDYSTWGWDEISWFTNLAEADRNGWLEYAVGWLANNDLCGYLQMPGCIPTNAATDRKPFYRANSSATCADGKNQEETIKRIWSGNN
ncbi:MAG: hypothetical protein LBU62_02285 [Bacteroidales bacterium]|nr:hypothetical protein [Bacteroidales bacterium]